MVNMLKSHAAALLGDGDIRADIEAKHGPQGIFLDSTPHHRGACPQMHHYLPCNERYFGPWRKPGLRFLEIGVSRGRVAGKCGGSISGPDAVIFGIDIDRLARTTTGRRGSEDRLAG